MAANCGFGVSGDGGQRIASRRPAGPGRSQERGVRSGIMDARFLVARSVEDQSKKCRHFSQVWVAQRSFDRRGSTKKAKESVRQMAQQQVTCGNWRHPMPGSARL